MSNKNLRIFVDMDGTLAEYAARVEEDWYTEGYYINARPYKKVVKAIQMLIKKGYDVYVLSACLRDCPFAKKEKNDWLDKYLPEINAEHRLLMYCGESKAEAVAKMTGKKIDGNDILYDDYTRNLKDWQNAGGCGIKLMNGRNGHHGTWQGFVCSKNDSARQISRIVEYI